MRKMVFLFGVVILFSMAMACKTPRMNVVKDAVLAGMGPVLENIARSYGDPYGDIVQSVFVALQKPSYESSGYYQSSYSQQDYDQSSYNQPYYYEPSVSSQPSYDQSQTYDSGFNSYSYSESAGTPQLEVVFDVVKEVSYGGTYAANSVMDGDTLTQDDNYKIMFQSSVPCYMYVVQLDSTGKMDPIFPSKWSSGANPLEAYSVYEVPVDNNWFYLDRNMGIETIYFIASLERRSDIENLLYELESANQSLVQRERVSMDSYVPIYRGVSRGVGGVRQGGGISREVTSQNGSQLQYDATLIGSIQADFVMTRWFHHQ
jgi:hypothetical protein